MSRILKDFFYKDLTTGCLSSLINHVKADNTLDLQIRNNYINIYYRGGNALKVSYRNKYLFEYDSNYFKSNPFSLSLLNQYKLNKNWPNYFTFMKQAMDIYFTISQKEEREFQQLVIRENNSSAIANGTDYFIIDIEYVIAHARFDIVAVEWESNTSKRKLQKRYLPKLVLIEMKVGDKSLKNKAGLQKHLFDFNNFLNNPNLVSKFKSEMIELFRQKRKLGLIPALTGNSNDVYQFDDTIELMFLIANHDPESNVLRNEVKLFANSNTSFMTANFMGYAMYKDSKMSLTDLLSRF